MKIRKEMTISLALILTVVGLIAVLLFLGQRSRGQLEPGVPSTQGPTPTPVVVDISQMQEAVEQTRTSIALSDVTGGTSAGTATRSFDGQRFVLTIFAELTDLGPGEFYEGWLMSQQEQPAVISTGRLNVAGPGQYATVFGIGRPMYGHSQVIVTRETADDGQPETHILEGRFE